MNNCTFDTPFQDRIKEYNGAVRSYDPFPKKNLQELLIPESLRKRLLSEGKEYLAKPYAQICASDYMQFVRTGNRSDFEQKYFSRRHRLCALVTAILVEENEEFLDEIIDGIFCISEESTWVLPAHNSYIRDTPQLILPDVKRPVLDLFACETAALLAISYYILKDKLDSVSDLIGKNIFDQINDRLIKPYLNEHFWWMGDGDEPMCNWTPWCTQNVLITAFVLPFEDDIRRKVIQQAAYSLDCFMKDYGDDGCCDEGAQYYRHAGLCLFHCMDILNTVTDNALSDMFVLPKIRNIASYIVNVHACGDYYINFSDCAAKAGRMGVREFLFGKACGLDALMQASADDFDRDCRYGDPLADESQKLNLYLRVLTLAHSGDVLQYNKNTDGRSKSTVRDIYYPSVGLMVARSPRFVLAAKAGDNNDNHNHNDTGSFTLYLDGQPLFVDIGVETYSKKTFSENRYDIWTMQSGYHNLPTICGLDQKAGEEYRATSVNCDLGSDLKTISMHLEDAYPLQDIFSVNNTFSAQNNNNESVTYIRSITLDASAETITLTDSSNCNEVILNFITYEEMIQTDDPNMLLLGNAIIRFNGASIITQESLPITDPRLMLSWDHNLNRIRVRKEAAEFTMTVRPAS